MMTDFTSDMLREVLNYGFDRGVGAELTYKLKPYTPSVSNPETRWIAVNMNWHKPKQLPYQAAHEIMHVLHQDPACLYFYSASKNSICLLYTSDACRRRLRCRSRWSPYH